MHFILIVYLILVQNEKGNDITHGAREIYFNIVTEITFLISITINMVHESWDLKRNCEHRIYRVYKTDYIYCWKVYNWKRYADFALTIVNSWNLRVSIYQNCKRSRWKLHSGPVVSISAIFIQCKTNKTTL